MKLAMVTLTGADGSADIQHIVDLSEEFPFVEWGILVSKKQMGQPRFPREGQLTYLEYLLLEKRHPALKLSLHLCGEWLRRLLKGDDAIFKEMPFSQPFGLFQRIQLNFHGEDVDVDTPKFHEILDRFAGRQFIFQVDGNQGQQLLEDYILEHDPQASAVPLFDVSHGSGTSPNQWPEPVYIKAGGDENDEPTHTLTLHGYAGGIGPSNVIHELERIQEVVGAHGSVWVDMETKLRSEDNRMFDLRKCRAVLMQCQDRCAGNTVVD